VCSLYRFLLRSHSHLIPKRTAGVPVKPGELLLSYVESGQVVRGSLRIHEWQANGDDFVRFANRTRQVASPNGFVDWLREARAAPEVRGKFDDLAEDGDIVTLGDVFARDPGRDGRHGLGSGFGCGFHVSVFVERLNCACVFSDGQRVWITRGRS
jgi:hypothetical protein